VTGLAVPIGKCRPEAGDVSEAAIRGFCQGRAPATENAGPVSLRPESD
jgi:hypothetical protein